MSMLSRGKGRVNRGVFKFTAHNFGGGLSGLFRANGGNAGSFNTYQHWNGIRLLEFNADALNRQVFLKFQQPLYLDAPGGSGKPAGSTKFLKLNVGGTVLNFADAVITASSDTGTTGTCWLATWTGPFLLWNTGVVVTVTVQDDSGTVVFGNQAPVNILPGSQLTNQNTNLVFSGAQGNLISINDDSGSVSSTLSVTSGTLTVKTGGGATITSNASASVTMAGTVDQVNDALSSVTFAPVNGFTGDVTLTLETGDGSFTVTNSITISVTAANSTQADTFQTPLVRHPVDWLRTGDSYIGVDGRWGMNSNDPSVQPNLVEGPNSYDFRQYIAPSIHDNPDGSGAMRWHLYWPRFNSNGYPCDPLDLTAGQVSYYSEVKSYPSMCIGPKPGFFGSDIYPAFGNVVRDKDGAPISHPPQFAPQPIVDDWQEAGGSPVLDAPSGNTYGDGLKLPLKLPMTGQTCLIRGRWKEFMAPTGRGHLSLDIWLTQTALQIKGHVQSSLTHELMIPLRYWGGYGKFGNRNPGWYIEDVTIGGVLYHVYATKDSPVSDRTGTVDGLGDVTTPEGFNYYSGYRYNFGGLDTVNHYTNEETGLDRRGWKLVVFEFDGGAGNPDLAAHPVDANGYVNLDLSLFTAYLAGKLDSRGIPFIQNTEYLQSLEIGIEPVWGECDVGVYDWKVLPSTGLATMPALPTYTNTAPTNHVPGTQAVDSNVSFVFGDSNNNQIWVVDKDNDTLTTTVSVPAASGTLTVVSGSGATVTGNGTLSVQLVGKPSQINTALNGMTYLFAGTGTVVLTVATSDGVAATATNTVSLNVQAASNAPTILQTQFDAPNNNAGIWLENLLTDMSTDPAVTTNPVSWTGTIARWFNHGAANGHDFLETVNTSYPNLGTDASGKNYVNAYSGNTAASVGGATTAFYACFVVDWTNYYGTMFSDQDVANHGVRLYQSADLGQWVFSAGDGTTFKTAACGNGLAQFASPIGKAVVDCWFDGTNLNVRMNKGTAGVTALGAASITAGNANMQLFSNWGGGDSSIGNTYAGVILKNYCPPSADRDSIASYFGAKAGLVV